MILKTALAFAMWTASWVWLMTGRFTPLGVVGAYLLHGFAQLFMTFNVGHDANHRAYSKRNGLGAGSPNLLLFSGTYRRRACCSY